MVKTHKEFINSQAEKIQPDIFIKKEPEEIKPEIQKAFVLMYPEFERHEQKSFNFDIEVNGKKRFIQVIKNVVKIKDEDIKEYLMNRGYVLIKIL